MSISDWTVIIAILVAPLLAIQVQKIIESIKETRARKMQIFKALMATRATPLSPIHVEALNMIDIEFYKNKKVVEAWKLLNDSFSSYPTDPQQKNYDAQLLSCSEKSYDFRIDLLYEMSKVLGYNFDKVLLKRGCYTPKGHGDMELEQHFIRRGLANLLWGRSPLPVTVLDLTTQVPPKEAQPKEQNKIA